jgi:UDP-N-acetylmuramoylalanine--D-glutamate ligase
MMAKHAGINTAVGGNLGEPALDLIDPAIELYVLELSSFQLETVSSLHAKAAVVLNISEDHMDRYDSMSDYANAKARIYDDAQGAVVNLDDPAVTAMCLSSEAKAFTVSAKPKEGQYGLLEREGKTFLAKGNEALLCVNELNIHGRHNYANALAALALGEEAGLALPDMLSALKTFKGLSHRMEWVAEQNGIQFVNDSKATNVGATAAAVMSVDADVILIAGGIGKEQNFAPLRSALEDQAKAVVLFGKDAPLIGNALSTVCDVHYVESMAQAVKTASGLATSGDMVLLSPACASFDMYKGFEARGEDFRGCVEQLLKEAV